MRCYSEDTERSPKKENTKYTAFENGQTVKDNNQYGRTYVCIYLLEVWGVSQDYRWG